MKTGILISLIILVTLAAGDRIPDGFIPLPPLYGPVQPVKPKTPAPLKPVTPSTQKIYTPKTKAPPKTTPPPVTKKPVTGTFFYNTLSIISVAFDDRLNFHRNIFSSNIFIEIFFSSNKILEIKLSQAWCL